MRLQCKGVQENDDDEVVSAIRGVCVKVISLSSLFNCGTNYGESRKVSNGSDERY